MCLIIRQSEGETSTDWQVNSCAANTTHWNMLDGTVKGSVRSWYFNVFHHSESHITLS